MSRIVHSCGFNFPHAVLRHVTENAKWDVSREKVYFSVIEHFLDINRLGSGLERAA